MGVGILFALFAGNYVADENYIAIILTAGISTVGCLVFGAGRSLYLLIPICWGLTGRVTALPLPFDVRELVIILSSGFYISDLIFKRNRRKQKPEIIDLLIWINILYLVTVFFRNPVGINALGGDRVGGKPYFDVILGIMSYMIMSKVIITQKFASKLPIYVLWVSLFTGFAGALSMYIPSVAAKIAPLYSGFGTVNSVLGDMSTREIDIDDRFAFLQQPAAAFTLYICSQISPMKLFSPNHITQLLIYITGSLLALLSGYRNILVYVFLQTFVAVIIREKIIGFVKLSSILLMAIITIIGVSYSSIKLPFSVQRSLSFLPGDWDVSAVTDAKNSSEWRFEMWKIAMTTDQYIRNKILGDGFGFLRTDFEIMVDYIHGGRGFGGKNAQQERFMINGDFHSGPISAIRFVGYVGLLLFLILIFYSTKYAFETIKLAQGTPFEMCVYFYAIPMLLLPLFYILVFGDYRADFIGALFSIGMMKALRSAVNNYKEN
jgi:hypothetical protein